MNYDYLEPQDDDLCDEQFEDEEEEIDEIEEGDNLNEKLQARLEHEAELFERGI